MELRAKIGASARFGMWIATGAPTSGSDRYKAAAMVAFAAMKASQELIDFVTDLQAEAVEVRATTFKDGRGNPWVSAGKLNGLVAGCRLLIAKLGPFGRVWDEMLMQPAHHNLNSFERLSSVTDTIASALHKGRLSTVEEMASAELLGDLLEHAEVLLQAKFYLASAIVMRAVLEERLRKLCTTNNCSPKGQRPTIENFKQSLYTANVIDKIAVKDIDWMAGVGNAAAHHLAEYKDEDVPQLYSRLTAFLNRFAIA